jgi:hypothetical protein
VTVLPLILSPIGFGNVAETLTRVTRWRVLLILLLIGLAVLYGYGPERRAARWQWVTVASRPQADISSAERVVANTAVAPPARGVNDGAESV